MRISAKGRYALAAFIEIGRQTRNGEMASVISISETLGISKIFLEQAIAQLKKANLLLSTKGARGGYQLAEPAQNITVRDILGAVENLLLEKSDASVSERAPAIEAALRDKVWNKLDTTIENCLSAITIQDLMEHTDQQNGDQSFMLNM